MVEAVSTVPKCVELLAKFRDWWYLTDEGICDALDIHHMPPHMENMRLDALCQLALKTMCVNSMLKATLQEEALVLNSIVNYMKQNAVLLARSGGLPRGMCWARGIYEHIDSFHSSGLVHTLIKCLEGLLGHGYPAIYAARPYVDIEADPVRWLDGMLVDIKPDLRAVVLDSFSKWQQRIPTIHYLQKISMRFYSILSDYLCREKAIFNVCYNRLVVWTVELMLFEKALAKGVLPSRVNFVRKLLESLFGEVQSALADAPMCLEKELLLTDLARLRHSFSDSREMCDPVLFMFLERLSTEMSNQ